jgi:hypothetical protein
MQRNYQVVIDNLLTSTWYDVRKKLYKDIFQITPLYDKMVESGRIKERVPDGTHFEIPFAYAKLDQNAEWFGRGHGFGMEEKEFMTRMLYQVRNLGDNIVRYWDDERKNKGKARILNYVQEVIDMHKATLMDKLATSMWTTGGALAINTLPSLISTTPTTGTVGGIDRSTNEYLQNLSVDGSSVTQTTLTGIMENTYNRCSLWKSMSGGTKAPDVIITTQVIYEAYVDLARAMGVYEFNNTSRRVDLGMGNAMFKGAEMFWDPDCPTGTMYMLNTPSLEFAYDPDNWMEMTEWKTPANSLDRMAQVVCVGQLCANNFRKNAVIHTLTDTTLS